MAKVIVMYSVDSAPTVASATIAGEMIKVLRKEGHEVIELSLWKALRPGFILTYMLNKVDGIFYAGHGIETAILGQLPLGLFLPPIRAGDRVKTKIIYAVACLTAKKLGRSIAPRFTRAYLGNRDLTYIAYPAKERNYLNDIVDAFVTPVRILAKGGTAGQAYRALRNKLLYYYDLYRRHSRVWSNADYYAYAMKENLEGFTLIGDANATL